MSNDKKRSDKNRERKENFWDVKLKGNNEREMEDDNMEEDENVSKMPPNLKIFKDQILINESGVQNMSTYSSSIFNSLGIDNSFSLKDFKNKMKINILSMEPDDKKESRMVFDIIGIEAPVANALRRILLSEVPTMAIETVYFNNNTSIIPDELLAHRLGLIPIYADPENFENRENKDEPTTEDTLIFRLNVKCYKNEKGEIINDLVKTDQLIWTPQGEQLENLDKDYPRTVHNDIVIAKLKPGQCIEVECHAIKGNGKEHAKWSPVSTAFYRLKPKIEILEQVKGKKAEELVNICPMGVFDIEDSVAVVSRPQNCTVCRECIRPKEWQERIRLSRIKNHFTFSIESTGIIHPKEIFKRALVILQQKAISIIDEVTEFEKSMIN